jgi:glycosyltransferase involved in cell wall biosynthesis
MKYNEMKFMNNPLISIITVVYNGASTLEQTILSVINQTYKNIEYIIIDGGSTDGTVDIIKKYENKLAYWVSEPDNGIYYAMNKGIERATGELIGIINSDDWYELDAIDNIVSHYSDSHTILYGLIKNYYPNGEFFVNTISSGMIEQGLMLSHPTCFVPKILYDNMRLFDTKYKSCADFDFILRVKSNNVNFFLVERIIANYRFGGFSSCQRNMIETIKYNRVKKLIGFKEYLLRYLYIKFLRKHMSINVFLRSIRYN